MNPSRNSAPPDSQATAATHRLAGWAVLVLVLLVPLVVLPTARDSFRLPKLMVAEWLGLLSLVLLSLRRRTGEVVTLARKLLAAPACQAVAPLVLVATFGLATSAHPEHVRRALPALWIGAACLVGWATAFDRSELERLLRWGIVPAAFLALLAVLQFYGLFRPFGFAAGIASGRLGVTSLAGNPGDLGSFLVLPCLVAQERIWSERGLWRWLWAGALGLCSYGLALTQTLTALAGLAVGSLLLWAMLLPRRRALAWLAASLAVMALGLTVVAPLRDRVAGKLGDLARGDWDSLLTYRLDAWSVAGWMLRQHPLSGVGHGAFVTEFTPAKLALLEGGRLFPDRGTFETAFANAHNDVLEVAAELGWPGLLATIWGAATIGAVAWRRTAPDRPLVLAGLAAMAVVSLASFPFETALVGYSWTVFLAWILASQAALSPPVELPIASRSRGGRGSRR